jgi:L-alanine-DL-glutamate epimerase-like enolase superfamily enzyme
MVVRRHVAKPMVLDESVTTLEDLLAIHRMGLADGITLKIARVGGVMRTRELRDLAVDMGLLVTVEDTGGAEIDTAAMAHLSLSTPGENRMHAIAFHQWVNIRTAHNAPPVHGSKMGLPEGPGLGIDVDEASLGDPFYSS